MHLLFEGYCIFCKRLAEQHTFTNHEFQISPIPSYSCITYTATGFNLQRCIWLPGQDPLTLVELSVSGDIN